MNKVLVEICIPAIDDRFDIFAPVDVPVKELSSVLANGIAELTGGKFVPSKYEQICLKEPAGMLNPSLCLQDYGIKDGMQLYLV